MKYIECPQKYQGNFGEYSLFIAGGITGCRNWQEDLVSMLENEDIIILNPRRKYFDINNQTIEFEQIKWEFDHLSKADAISFWFPCETLCPITLYELGKQIMINKQLFIGVDPNYRRIKDVEIQTRLIKPEIEVVYSLSKLAEQIKDWRKSID